MKILFVASLYYPRLLGGAERVVKILAEAMLGLGHLPVIATLAPTHEEGVRWVNGVKVHYVGLKNVYWPYDASRPAFRKPLWHLIDMHNPVMGARLRRVLETEGDFDVVHTHHIAGFSVAAWNAAHTAGIPIIHTLHDYYMLCIKGTMFKKGRPCSEPCAECKFASIPKRRSARHITGVTGVSDFVLQQHRDQGLFSNTLTDVIYNPISDPKPHDGKPATSTLREKVRFGYLGRLHPTKGIETFLEALAETPNEGIEALIAGEGDTEYEKSLQQLAGPSVRFLGTVDGERFLKDIDVLVVPSLWYENSPMVIYEAYAAGVPVIGSDRGGIPELVREGETGFTFRAGDQRGLADIMLRLSRQSDLLRELSDACRIHAQSFSLQNVCPRYLDLYGRAIRARRHGNGSIGGQWTRTHDLEALRAVDPVAVVVTGTMQASGFSTRISSMLQAYTAKDLTVDLYHLRFPGEEEPYTEVLDTVSRYIPLDMPRIKKADHLRWLPPVMASSLKAARKKLSPTRDYSLVQVEMTNVWKASKVIRGSHRLIVFHDDDWMKFKRFAASASDPAHWVSAHLTALRYKLQQRTAMREADMCWFVSQDELERMSGSASGTSCHLIPNGVDSRLFEIEPLTASASPVATFVGPPVYEANARSIKWFLASIWPRIHSLVPDARLRLVGPGWAEWLGTGRDGIETPGFVTDLNKELATAGVIVAPLLAGGGTKIKVLEGMAAARPIVCTPIAAEGLPNTVGTTITSDAETFARCVKDWFANGDRARSGGLENRKAVLPFRWEAVWDEATSILNKLIGP